MWPTSPRQIKGQHSRSSRAHAPQAGSGGRQPQTPKCPDFAKDYGANVAGRGQQTQCGNGIRRAPQEEMFEPRPRRKATTQSCVAGRGQLWWRLRGARVAGAPGRVVVVTRAGGHRGPVDSANLITRHHQGPKEKRPLKACGWVGPWLAQAQRAHSCGSSLLSRPGSRCTAGGHRARPAPGTERVAGPRGQPSGGVKSSRAQRLLCPRSPAPSPALPDPSWLPAAWWSPWEKNLLHNPLLWGTLGTCGRQTVSPSGSLLPVWDTSSLCTHWRHPLM